MDIIFIAPSMRISKINPVCHEKHSAARPLLLSRMVSGVVITWRDCELRRDMGCKTSGVHSLSMPYAHRPVLGISRTSHRRLGGSNPR